jgi:beta-mannosidase
MRKGSGKYFVDVTSERLAKSVFLTIEGADGMFTDNYFDLFPNQVKTVEFIPVKGAKIELKDLKSFSLVDSFTDR